MHSTADELRGKIPEVEKDLKKCENELASMVTQENKVANEVSSSNIRVWMQVAQCNIVI